jgi:uncharacterized Zn finger protein
MGWYSDDNWRPYVPVAERRRQAVRKIAKMKKAGHKIRPVEIAGRKIAATFWGDAWCKNLESYSDFSNRLPRGRTYVRNGSVIDLQIEAGRVRALVSGTEIYKVEIGIKPLPRKQWTGLKSRCAGQIDSLVELLQGSISRGVMEIVTRKGEGLFPSPREITLSCSCPDWASMCKHVAATLYGVGARLDHEPELLFTLRCADPAEMVEAVVDQPPGLRKSRKGPVLKSEELSSIFGIDIEKDGVSSQGVSAPAEPPKKPTARKPAAKKPAAKKPTAKKPTTRKPAAKKPAAKKPTAKKPAAKKATTKKPTTRKPAAKKPAAKKPAAKKATTKLPAAKKPAAKKATTKKAAAKTATAKKPAARKAESR